MTTLRTLESMKGIFSALEGSTGLGFRAHKNNVRFAYSRGKGVPFEMQVQLEPGEIRLVSNSLISLPQNKLEHFRNAVGSKIALDPKGDYFALRANIEDSEPDDQLQADLKAALVSVQEAIGLLPDETIFLTPDEDDEKVVEEVLVLEGPLAGDATKEPRLVAAEGYLAGDETKDPKKKQKKPSA